MSCRVDFERILSFGIPLERGPGPTQPGFAGRKARGCWMESENHNALVREVYNHNAFDSKAAITKRDLHE